MIFEQVQKLLAEQLNVDSLDVVEMLMSLEDHFGITVPDEVANELVTVGAIVDYIEKAK